MPIGSVIIALIQTLIGQAMSEIAPTGEAKCGLFTQEQLPKKTDNDFGAINEWTAVDFSAVVSREKRA